MDVQENIPNYLWQAIAITILCCLPLGIPAIVFAAKVNGLVADGQMEEAKAASGKAKMWCWLGFGLGLVAMVVQGVISVVSLVAASGLEGY